MNLKPVGNRVIIKPDKPAEQTESGLWLSEHPKPDQCGEVVAVGTFTHPRKQEAEEVAALFEEHAARLPGPADWADGIDIHAAALLRALIAREPSVKVGDWVIFSWQSGQELTIDGEKYLVMLEDDLLCVLEGVA